MSAAMLSLPVLGKGLDCTDATPREDLTYKWQLRGGLAWIAGFKFPTWGSGQLVTSNDGTSVHSRLDIRSSPGKQGKYYYESTMSEGGRRSLVSQHGYNWDEKDRDEYTVFDYVKHVAHVKKVKAGAVTLKDKPIPSGDMQDVLTGIYFLRRNAASIRSPLRAEIYSDGKTYPIVFKPLPPESLTLEGVKVPTSVFLVTAAPEAQTKWPGGLKVWLSNDIRRVPVRIEIQRSFASVQLDLTKITSCGLTVAQARKP